MNPTMNDVGDLQTQVAALSFLDLPPEIRNLIYRLVLVQGRPVAVDRNHDSVNAMFTLTSSLLRANRQISAEAAPIFYGMNSFTYYSESFGFGGFGSFYNSATGGFNEKQLLDWLTRIGRFRAHLSDVKLDRVKSQAVLRSAFNLLKDATGLSTLHLSWNVVDQFDSSSMRCDFDRHRHKDPAILVPWLRCLQKARRTNGAQSAQVLDVLRLEDQKQTSWQTLDYHQAEKAKHEAMLASLKAQLETRLA